jgi:hypothetical protein
MVKEMCLAFEKGLDEYYGIGDSYELIMEDILTMMEQAGPCYSIEWEPEDE